MSPPQHTVPRRPGASSPKVLVAVVEDVLRDWTSVKAWTILYMFVKCILPAGNGPRTGDAYSQAAVVKERLARWGRGQHLELWKEAVAATRMPAKKTKMRKTKTAASASTPEMVEPKAGQTQEVLDKKNGERALKAVRDGQYTRGIQALLSRGMAKDTAATVKKLKEKHPDSEEDPAAYVIRSDTPQMKVTGKQVQDALQSFKHGTASGPDGLKPEHWRVAVGSVKEAKQQKALTTLTRLVNGMLEGKIPENESQYICGARLHAAVKKEGGIRPIAVGNVHRRLVSKVVSFAVADRAAGILKPHQVGGGSERWMRGHHPHTEAGGRGET